MAPGTGRPVNCGPSEEIIEQSCFTDEQSQKEIFDVSIFLSCSRPNSAAVEEGGQEGGGLLVCFYFSDLCRFSGDDVGAMRTNT